MCRNGASGSHCYCLVDEVLEVFERDWAQEGLPTLLDVEKNCLGLQ